MAWYQDNTWGYTYPAVEEAPDHEARLICWIKQQQEYQLKREEEWRVIWTCEYCGEYGHFAYQCKDAKCANCGEVGHFAYQCKNVEATDVKEMVQQEAEKDSTIPEKELQEQMVQTLTIHVLERDTVIDNEDAVMSLSDNDELADPLDEEKMEMESLASLEDGPTEIVEKPTLATTETLSDAEQNNISMPLLPTVVHSHYIIVSDTFFTEIIVQSAQSPSQRSHPTSTVGKMTPASVANLSVGERSTQENEMSLISFIQSILGSTYVDNEDELIQVMEWFKLEFEFG